MTNKENHPHHHPPLIFATFKPTRMTSQQVVSYFKKNMPFQKMTIGHFGTLDPFASGLLFIGIGGASRLNDQVHEFLPKTYLSVGKLGLSTDSGDYTGATTSTDETEYLKNIAGFSKEFIEEQLNKKFLGDYWQAPHKISDAKFEGKPLHYWTRLGVEIHKEKKLKKISKIEVVKWKFPYLTIRFEVSSGTYIRTLFSECAEYLGTVGTLIALTREQIGSIHIKDALKKNAWPKDKTFIPESIPLEKLLPFSELILNVEESLYFKNGGILEKQISDRFVWVKNEDRQILGLGETFGEGLKAKINFQVVV